MVYSSGSSSVLQVAKTLLAWPLAYLASRKIETSDPAELDEEFLKAELGFQAINPGEGESGSNTLKDGGKRAFARPKGPGKRR